MEPLFICAERVEIQGGLLFFWVDCQRIFAGECPAFSHAVLRFFLTAFLGLRLEDCGDRSNKETKQGVAHCLFVFRVHPKSSRSFGHSSRVFMRSSGLIFWLSVCVFFSQNLTKKDLFGLNVRHWPVLGREEKNLRFGSTPSPRKSHGFFRLYFFSLLFVSSPSSQGRYSVRKGATPVGHAQMARNTPTFR